MSIRIKRAPFGALFLCAVEAFSNTNRELRITNGGGYATGEGGVYQSLRQLELRSKRLKCSPIRKVGVQRCWQQQSCEASDFIDKDLFPLSKQKLNLIIHTVFL